MHDQLFNIWSLFNQACPLCDIHPGIASGPCQSCLNDLPHLLQACNRCALPGSHNLCPSCQQQPPPYSRATAGFNYRFPLPQLIHSVKTGRDPEPLHWLASALATKIRERICTTTTLVPVPMHIYDETLRGFNQSALLCDSLSRLLNLPQAPNLLVKSRRTPHQASLNRAERKANLKECYRVISAPPEEVTLVDDVMTTGTTLERLTRLLLQSGCKKVDLCVLCRTPN